MQTVPVYLLEVDRAYGQVHVTFARFISHQSFPTKLSGHVVTSKPLRVQITVPPGGRVPNMHEFEGHDVELVLQPVFALPLNNGE